MEKIILVRYTEIHLKGLNRPFFEKKLISNMKGALRGIPSKIAHEQGRIYVHSIPEDSFDTAVDRLTRVFGIHSLSPAYVVDKDWDNVINTCAELMQQEIERRGGGPASFKVFARRSDKHYFMNSDAINHEMGYQMLIRFP
ncbi:MAG: THUMP domain-containing protein, partial [Clostridiales bacterium]|nr:THUMP domain-containing protein [Clostridiales bacterium]